MLRSISSLSRWIAEYCMLYPRSDVRCGRARWLWANYTFWTSDLSRLTCQVGEFYESENFWREASARLRSKLGSKNESDMCQLQDRLNGFLASEDNEIPTDLDLPHLTFTVTRCLLSKRTSARRVFYFNKFEITFQSNGSVVSKLIWIELKINLSHAYFEKRSLDGQCSTRVSPDVTVRNLSVSERMGILKIRRTCSETNEEDRLPWICWTYVWRWLHPWRRA